MDSVRRLLLLGLGSSCAVPLPFICCRYGNLAPLPHECYTRGIEDRVTRVGGGTVIWITGTLANECT